MNTVNFHTEPARAARWTRMLGVAALAAATWGLGTTAAHARGDDVYWSIGVSSPGVAVGVSNAPPPRHVVVQPQPVVIHQPAPVVIHQPYPYVRPVVVQPRPVVYPGWGYGPRWDDRYERRHWKHHHRHHDRWDDDDRGGRRGDGRR